ncbi:hypothetical protein DFH06DRAFT_1153104 [Mycena polygramma]|nr:hypothetical protein DFH06DRAFT_1153104 [Mycena polygramma]
MSPGFADSDYDAIFGASFLRNVYAIYNFGNTVSHSPTANASVQLLSQTDPTAVVTDVLNIRMARLSGQSPAPAGAAVVAAAAAAATGSSATESQVHKYAPIVIGLLGANLLVAIMLAAIGLVLCLKKRGGKNGRSTNYAPMSLAGDAYEDKRYSD